MTPASRSSRRSAGPEESQVTYLILSEPEDGHTKRPMAVFITIRAADEAAHPAGPFGVHLWNSKSQSGPKVVCR